MLNNKIPIKRKFSFIFFVCGVIACCPVPPTPELDSDGDGVFDNADNCPQGDLNGIDLTNPDQTDNDQDGLGDLCDANPLDSNSFNANKFNPMNSYCIGEFVLQTSEIFKNKHPKSGRLSAYLKSQTKSQMKNFWNRGREILL